MYFFNLHFATLCCLLGLGLSSCMRTSAEVWDDSTTASRHMERSLKALGGKQGDSQMVASRDEFMGRRPQARSIAFEEESSVNALSFSDLALLDDFEQSNAIPQAKHSPGEVGSAIPGIESFMDPALNPSLARIFRNVSFPYNSNSIKGQDNYITLKTISDWLRRNPRIHMFIEGHCDEDGAHAYNLALGTKRANAIRTYLVDQGVAADRLFTISYGKEKPIAMGHDEKARQQNRRGQFRIYEKVG